MRGMRGYVELSDKRHGQREEEIDPSAAWFDGMWAERPEKRAQQGFPH